MPIALVIIVALLGIASPAQADWVHAEGTGWYQYGYPVQYEGKTYYMMRGYLADQDPLTDGVQIEIMNTRRIKTLVVCFPDNRLGGYQENGSYAWNYYATNKYIPVSATPRLVTVLSADIKTLWSQFEPLLARKFDAATQFESRYWKITYDDGSTVTLPDRGFDPHPSRDPNIDIGKSRPSRLVAVDPKAYLASIYYDGNKDGPEKYGEELFPIKGDNGNLISTYQDYGGWNTALPNEPGIDPFEELRQDEVLNVEDAMEIYVPRQITSEASGTSIEGHNIGYAYTTSHPNDQSPAIYFHKVNLGTSVCPVCHQTHPGWEVWEYWIYYAANPTNTVKSDPLMPYPPHEHDWETYWIYFQQGVPVGVRLSAHQDYREWPADKIWILAPRNVDMNCTMWHAVTWSDLLAKNLVEMDAAGRRTHMVLNCEGNDSSEEVGRLGSHAFLEPREAQYQDGVSITFDGRVFPRGGSLAAYQAMNHWRIFSADGGNTLGSPFSPQNSRTYFMGDSWLDDIHTVKAETGGDMGAPWVREKWQRPYCWNCIYGSNPYSAPVRHVDLLPDTPYDSRR